MNINILRLVELKIVKNGLFYLMLILLMVTAACGGSGQKPKKDTPSELRQPIEQPKKEKPAKRTPRKDANPVNDNTLDRGKQKKESIVDKFDNFGNLIERTENDYDKQGNIRFRNRYTYRYDEKQRRVEQWFYQSTPDEKPVFSNVNHMKYDDKDRKTENIFIGYDSTGNEINWVKNVFMHNDDGRVTEDVTFNKEGFPIFKVSYKYDEGLLKSESFVYYDGQGGVTEKKTLKYDEFGTIIQTIEE